MKYMGSKQWMLRNGLGELLSREAPTSKRFWDLFSGSAAVAHYVAERKRSYRVPQIEKITKNIVSRARKWCSTQDDLPITLAYGGHYFSPSQAVWVDVLRRTVPNEFSARAAAIASLIQAASQCAAAPGHTAQPFKPTRSAKVFLRESWDKDIVSRTRKLFAALCARHARVVGAAVVSDANDAAARLDEGDLVFIDPPYSGVHYSRFYHVLETIALGRCRSVTGVGRYPPASQRPISEYSIKSKSRKAVDELLQTVAKRGAKAIFTFPSHECSNGLSGGHIQDVAEQYFRVSTMVVKSKFSTLGGKKNGTAFPKDRAARQNAKELILCLEPR